MSKFFNETKKAQDWAPNEEVAKDPDLQVVLESMRHADAVSAQVTETRVRSAHRIEIPHQPGVPLIVGNGSSNGYGEEAYSQARRGVLPCAANAPLAPADHDRASLSCDH